MMPASGTPGGDPLDGQGQDAPRSLLHPLLVALAVAAIMALAQLAAVFIEMRLSGEALPDLVRGRATPDGAALVGLMRVTALAQLGAVALVGLVAVVGGHGMRRALRLAWPAQGVAAFALPLAMTLGLLVAINGFVAYVLGHDLLADLELYRRALGSPARGWVIGAIAIGAPVSEELLFRGLLLPALAATRLGFVPAAVLSTLAWAGLHFTYSWAGLAEVALAGLVLCWAWRRSGSLWVPIACHAVYNGTILLALLVWAG